MADIADLGGNTEVLGFRVVGEGIDETTAQLFGVGDAAERAGRRAGDAASDGATKFSQAFADAARKAKNALDTEFATNTAGIREALARELITDDQARAAGAEAAAAYKSGLLSAIDKGDLSGAFSGDKGATVYRDLTSSLQTAIAAENAHAAAARQVLAAEQAAYAIEEQRQAGLRQLAAAEQSAYAEDARREAEIRKMALVQAEAIALDERRTASMAAAAAASTAIEEQRQAGLRQLAAAEQSAYAEDARREGEIRKMALVQAEAIALDERRTASMAAAAAASTGTAGALQAIESGATKSGASLNTLRGSITAMLASSLQTAPGVAQLGSAVGALAVGTATTVGVLAGIAAISAVYHALTDDTTKAREEQDKLVASLDQWYDRQRGGSNFELDKQIVAATAHLKELRAEAERPIAFNIASNPGEAFKDALKAVLDAPFDPQAAIAKFSALWAIYASGQQAAIAKTADEIAAANRQKIENQQTDALQTLTGQSNPLSTLVGAGRASPGQGAQIIGLLRDEQAALTELRARYAELTDAKDKAFSLSLQAQYLAGIQAIKTGLRDGMLLPLKDILAEQDLYNNDLKAYLEINAQAIQSIERQGAALEKRKPYLIGEQEYLEHLAAANKIIADLPAPKIIGAENIKAEQARLADVVQEAKLATEATARLIDGFAAQLHRRLSDGISGGIREGLGALGGILDTALTVVERYAPQIAEKLFSHDVTQTSVDANGNRTSITTSQPGLDAHDTKELGYFAVAAQATLKFADSLNELTGAVHHSAQDLERTLEARASFYQQFTQYQDSARLSQLDNPTLSAIAQAQAQAKQERDAAEAALGGKASQGARENVLAQIDAIEKTQIDKIRADFSSDITRQLNELRGPAGSLDNTLNDLEKQYLSNKAAAIQLGLSTDDVTKLYREQVDAAKAAYAEGQQQLRFSEDAREAAATGNDVLAAAITRRAQEEDELFKDSQAGYTADQLARVKYIQGLEDERAALLALTNAQNALAQNLAKGPTGTLTDQQNADLAPLNQKLSQDSADYDAAVKLLADDIAAGADAATVYADNQRILTEATLVAGDQAAITAAKFANAAAQMSAAQSAIQRDINLGFITPGKGREEESQAFFGANLSDDEIRAKYKIYNGQPLSNADEQTNKLIEQFFRDFPAAVASAASDAAKNATAAGQTPSPSDAVSYAARNLSEVTGNRLADIDFSQLSLIRDIRDDVHFMARGGGSGQASRIVADQQAFYNGLSATPLPNFSPPSAAPSTQRIVVAPGTPQTVTIKHEHTVNVVNGKIDRTDLHDYVEEIAEELETVLVRRANLQRFVGGNPLLAGG